MHSLPGHLLGATTIATLLLLLCGSSGAAPAEAELQAAFVLRLADFVTWPAGAAGGAFRIAVVGDGDVKAALARMGAEGRIAGREIEVVAGLDGGTPEVAFLGRGAVASGLAALDGTPALTLSAAAGFAQRGGMIELAREGDRIRIDVNRGILERSGLRISSKVLSLARAVYD